MVMRKVTVVRGKWLNEERVLDLMVAVGVMPEGKREHFEDDDEGDDNDNSDNSKDIYDYIRDLISYLKQRGIYAIRVPHDQSERGDNTRESEREIVIGEKKNVIHNFSILMEKMNRREEEKTAKRLGRTNTIEKFEREKENRRKAREGKKLAIKKSNFDQLSWLNLTENWNLTDLDDSNYYVGDDCECCS